MAEEIVEVVIAPDGTLTLSVTGIAGMACLTETEGLAALLGGDIESQELTGEAYVEAEQDEQDRLWH